MKNLTKDEKSLLLFFETAYVDHAGKLNPAHMNDADRKIAEKWNNSGYVEFGRVRYSDITNEKTNYVFLSAEAMNDAHQERKERAERMQKARQWQTTKEKQSCPIN